MTALSVAGIGCAASGDDRRVPQTVEVAGTPPTQPWITLERLVDVVGHATGCSFVYSDDAQLGGRWTLPVPMAASTKLAVFSRFVETLWREGVTLTPLGSDEDPVLHIERVGDRKRWMTVPFVREEELGAPGGDSDALVRTSMGIGSLDPGVVIELVRTCLNGSGTAHLVASVGAIILVASRSEASSIREILREVEGVEVHSADRAVESASARADPGASGGRPPLCHGAPGCHR